MGLTSAKQYGGDIGKLSGGNEDIVVLYISKILAASNGLPAKDLSLMKT